MTLFDNLYQAMDKYDIYTKSANLIAKKMGTTVREATLTPHETYKQIQHHYPSIQSQNTIIAGLTLLAKQDGTFPKQVMSEWAKIREEAQTRVNDHYTSNISTERQKQGYVRFDEIVRIRDSLSEGPAKLLLGFYTYIAPVRNDYHQLRIFHEPPTQPYKGNYIVLGSINRMVLQEFKTANKYKKIETDIPQELVALVLSSLKKHPREYVFVQKDGRPYQTEKTFSAWANYNLKKVLNNDHINLTMLRHIYITEHCNKVMSYKDRTKISDVMGHSVTTQLKYAFNDLTQ